MTLWYILGSWEKPPIHEKLPIILNPLILYYPHSTSFLRISLPFTKTIVLFWYVIGITYFPRFHNNTSTYKQHLVSQIKISISISFIYHIFNHYDQNYHTYSHYSLMSGRYSVSRVSLDTRKYQLCLYRKFGACIWGNSPINHCFSYG